MSFVRQLLNYLRNVQYCFHLIRAISVTIRLPISSRKIVLSACQTGMVHRRDLDAIYIPQVRDPHHFDYTSKAEYYESLVITCARPVSRSLLWMITRTCPEPSDNDQSFDVRESGFAAEIGATQTIFSEHQQVSYSSFFRRVPGINDPGQWWVTYSHTIRDTFHKSMNGKVLYPAVNRSKNVSQDTMAAMNASSNAYDYVRSVDLETEYAKTGIQHQGFPEVRTAWKFNNLKPRVYYCTGGEQYWSSRYMKVIAVKIMEAIPSTHVKLRTSPTDYLSSDFGTDYVTAWDYSAFTSTLSELKHFIWFLARMSEADKTTVTLFDYRDGYQYDRPLYELLDEYNEVANIHARFSVHRMVGVFLDDNPELYASLNSGLLGVHGNIGFSTALHGLVICKECGEKRCVCVGDDGLGITSEDPSVSLIPAISRLGVLHPEKFGIIGPGDGDSYIKFLKRKFSRVGDTFILSFLINFPISAYIDGDVGSRDRPLRFTFSDRVYKFASHVGELLWDLQANLSELEEDDIKVALDTIRVGYTYMNLPMGGAFPGTRLSPPGEDPFELHFTIPCIRGYHPKEGDWIEFMIGHAPALFFKAPVFIPIYEYESLEAGVHMLPESKYLSAMEDLGLLETEKISEWIMVASVGSQRILNRMLRRVDDGMTKAVSVRVFEDLPERYVLRSCRKGVQVGMMDIEEL